MRTYPGKEIDLYCSVVADGLVAQPEGRPTIQIEYVDESEVVTELLAETVMTEIRAGEYYYRWTVPAVAGVVKIRYIADIDDVDVYALETLEVVSVEEYLGKLNEYRDFAYLENKNVDTVTIKHGDDTTPILTTKITFGYDAGGKVSSMDVEKQ